MIRVNSNADDVFEQLRQLTQRVENNMPIYVKRMAIDLTVLIAHRIQMRGQNADGGRLQTRARLRQGAYSQAYAKRRSARGRQIEQVDLTMNGDLMRSWNPIAVGHDSATVGFLDDRQADIAQYIEAYYGPVFSPSTQEEQQAIDAVIEEILDDLMMR